MDVNVFCAAVSYNMQSHVTWIDLFGKFANTAQAVVWQVWIYNTNIINKATFRDI